MQGWLLSLLQALRVAVYGPHVPRLAPSEAAARTAEAAGVYWLGAQAPDPADPDLDPVRVTAYYRQAVWAAVEHGGMDGHTEVLRLQHEAAAYPQRVWAARQQRRQAREAQRMAEQHGDRPEAAGESSSPGRAQARRSSSAERGGGAQAGRDGTRSPQHQDARRSLSAEGRRSEPQGTGSAGHQGTSEAPPVGPPRQRPHREGRWADYDRFAAAQKAMEVETARRMAAEAGEGNQPTAPVWTRGSTRATRMPPGHYEPGPQPGMWVYRRDPPWPGPPRDRKSVV